MTRNTDTFVLTKTLVPERGADPPSFGGRSELAGRTPALGGQQEAERRRRSRPPQDDLDAQRRAPSTTAPVVRPRVALPDRCQGHPALEREARLVFRGVRESLRASGSLRLVRRSSHRFPEASTPSSARDSPLEARHGRRADPLPQTPPKRSAAPELGGNYPGGWSLMFDAPPRNPCSDPPQS